MRKRRRIAILGVVLALLGLMFVKREADLRSQPDLQAVANRGAECLAKRDANCLYDLADPVEMREYGLTREQFATLLRELAPSDWQALATEVDTREGPGKSVILKLLAGQTEVPFSFRAQSTSEGVRLTDLVTGLILSRSVVTSQGASKTDRLIQVASYGRTSLEPLGLKGISRGPGEKFMTWDEYEAHYRKGPPIRQSTVSQGSQ